MGRVCCQQPGNIQHELSVQLIVWRRARGRRRKTNGVLGAGFENRRIRLSGQRCLEPGSFHFLLGGHIAGARASHRRCHRRPGFRAGCRPCRDQCGARPAAGAAGRRFHQFDPGAVERSDLGGDRDARQRRGGAAASGVFGEMRTALNTTLKQAKPSDEPIFSLIRSRTDFPVRRRTDEGDRRRAQPGGRARNN